MLKIGTGTKLSPEDAIKRAVEFFGPGGGYGLKVTEQTPGSACFEGGGGGVEVVACAGEEGTQVDLISREWDHQVREFISKIR